MAYFKYDAVWDYVHVYNDRIEIEPASITSIWKSTEVIFKNSIVDYTWYAKPVSEFDKYDVMFDPVHDSFVEIRTRSQTIKVKFPLPNRAEACYLGIQAMMEGTMNLY